MPLNTGSRNICPAAAIQDWLKTQALVRSPPGLHSWVDGPTRYTVDVYAEGRQRCALVQSAPAGETSKKPRIIVEINDNTGFFPSFLSESN